MRTMRGLAGAAAVVAVALLLLAGGARAIMVNVQPNKEECFFESIERGEKVLGSYNVAKGGFLDIDVKVFSPQGAIVYEEPRQSDGSFNFVAIEKGMHKLCFANSMSTVTAKTVSFNLYVGNALSSHGVAKQEHFTPLENSVLLLSEGLRSVDNEQKYIKGRVARCEETNDSTASRLVWWTLVQMAAVVFVAVAQVVYLKRLFEQKAKM